MCIFRPNDAVDETGAYGLYLSQDNLPAVGEGSLPSVLAESR